MKIGLFIPCFMNELYPDICKATYQVLKRQGLNVEYPLNQTCCGQPMANSGCSKDVKNLAINFVNTFKEFDYIVAPSGSCVSMVKEHYNEFFNNDKDYNKVKASIYEVCEFLHDIIKAENLNLNISFPYKVGLHNSCHGHRVLKLGTASEINVPYNSKLENILEISIEQFRKHKKLLTDLQDTKNKLADRKDVERAKVLLMQLHGLSEDDAFQLLRKNAMSHRMTIGEMARRLLDAQQLLQSQLKD